MYEHSNEVLYNNIVMWMASRVGLIRYVRLISNLGLVEAKNIVDTWLATGEYRPGELSCDKLIELSIVVGHVTSGDWYVDSEHNRFAMQKKIDRTDLFRLLQA